MDAKVRLVSLQLTHEDACDIVSEINNQFSISQDSKIIVLRDILVDAFNLEIVNPDITVKGKGTLDESD